MWCVFTFVSTPVDLVISNRTYDEGYGHEARGRVSRNGMAQQPSSQPTKLSAVEALSD